jgi:hypothetical protein
MPRARGVSLDNMRAFVEERYGAGAWERVLASLPATDRTPLRAVTAVGWYDVALQTRMLRAMDTTLGVGDHRVLVEGGRHNADRDLRGAQRLFLRLANPAYVLEKASDYWHRFYDSGSWHVVRESEGATGTLSHFDPGDEIFWVPVTAYVARMFELVGARDVRVHHSRRRDHGVDASVFVCRWR